MTDAQYWIQWIISDYTPFDFQGKAYYIGSPTRENRFLSERVFVLTFGEAIDKGLLDDSQLDEVLRKQKIWSATQQSTLDSLIKDIDEIKLNIFNSYTQSGKKAKLREALAGTRDYIERLTRDKQVYDQYTARGVATLAKQHYLLGSSLYRYNKKSALRSNWWLLRDDSIVQHAYKILADYILTDKDYRELARSNYWRTIWGNRRGGSLFGRASVDLSPSQQQLVTWSNIYDNIYKHSECPSDEVLEDDDAIDGWMIAQRRKRESATNQQTIEGSIKSERIRQSEEIYHICTEDNISKVYDCNDLQGKVRWNSIMNQTKKEGCVSHMKLNDTKNQLREKLAERTK